MNQLSLALKSPSYSFPNDVSVAGSTDREDFITDIRFVLDWIDKWYLLLNDSKCHLLSQSIEILKVPHNQGMFTKDVVGKVKDPETIMKSYLK